jgi:hypothetical protein
LVVRLICIGTRSFEEVEALTMKEVTWMLDMWLSEAFQHSSIHNDLLLVPKCPLKG